MKRRLLFLVLALMSTVISAQQTMVHPWSGAKVAFIGDSITDPGIAPEGHDWSGAEDWHYWGWLQKWLDIKPLVYGISGQRWSHVVEQAERLNEEHGSDFDAITIFMGANDFIADLPLGQWYDPRPEVTTTAMGYPPTKYEMIRRNPAMDPGTLRGCINIAVSTLKSMYPEKQIVILTPLHRAYATFAAQNIQPDESFPNRIGVYFSEYVDAIKEAGNVWGVPVIDLNSLSGLNPMVEEQLGYFSNQETDRLHPNAKGHERLARTLMYQLLTLPCRF